MEITVSSILRGFRARWIFFVATVGGLWILSGIYLLVAPLQYRAEADLVYVSHGSDSSSQLSGVAGLAASVGLRAPPANSERQTALAILKSREVMRDFIAANNLLPVLFPNIWDAQSKSWTVSPQKIPTLEDGAESLRRGVDITNDDDTGVISVSLVFNRQDLVAPIVKNFVAMADNMVRQRALQRSKDSLRYFESQLDKTNSADTRAMMIALIQQQLQQVALSQNSGPYAFDVVDPAIPPKKAEWPRPLLIFATMAILGIILAGIASIVADMKRAGAFS